MSGAPGPRIAVGGFSLDPRVPGGLNRFTSEILHALLAVPHADVRAFASAPGLRDRFGDRLELSGPPWLAVSDFRGNLGRLAWHQAVLPRLLRRARADVFYSTVPEGMLRPTLPQVITVHDLLPLRYPDVYPRVRHYFEHVVPRLVGASSAAVVVSAATAADVRARWGDVDTPLHVVHPGFDPGRFRPLPESEIAGARARFGLERYLLFVGEARPYKNLRALIAAVAGLADTDVQLAVVGRGNKQDPGIRQLPAELRVEGRVRFLGQVDDDDLPRLYGGAQAFVFPSLFEGFGIPPLEAMACGCPVVASTAASIPEVCGEAAVYVEPTSPAGIAQGIDLLLGDADLRAELARKGLERSASFSWRRAARRIVEILNVAAHA